MGQSILTNATIASIGRITNILAGLIVTALTTRLLSPTLFGQFVFVISVGTILQLAADFGLYLTLTRQLGHTKPEGAQQVFSDITTIRLVLLLIVSIAGLGGILLSSTAKQLLFPYIIISLGLAAQSLSQLIMGAFQAHATVWKATVGDLVGRLIQLIILGLALTSTPTTNPLLIVTIAFSGGLLISLGVHQQLLRQYLRLKVTYNWTRLKAIIQTSWPLGAMLLINAIYFRIDAVMLAYLRTPEEVGLYGLAYKLLESLLFFPAMLGGIVLPKITGLLYSDKTKANHLFQQTLQITLVAAGLIVLIVATYPNQVIQLITFSKTSPYLAAAPLVTILAIATGIIYIGNILGFTLVAAGQQKQLLKLYVALALGNALANYLTIPHFGATAAALTTLATELTATAAATIMIRRHLAITPNVQLYNRFLIVMSTTAFLVFLLTPSSPYVSIPVVVGAYLLATFATGLLRPQSLSLLRQKG